KRESRRILCVALGPRYPGPHENRRTQQRSVDGLASAIFVGARRGDERIFRIFSLSHDVKQPYAQHLSVARLASAARSSSFLLPAPVKGWAERRDGAFNDRACEARLNHAYEACIAPIPNRCARLSAFRLAVSAAGAALPWSLATATGPC